MTKANIGIIFSHSDKFSNESKNLSHYLCGIISSTAFANIFMVPLNPEGLPLENLPSGRIFYHRNNTDAFNKPIEIPV